MATIEVNNLHIGKKLKENVVTKKDLKEKELNEKEMLKEQKKSKKILEHWEKQQTEENPSEEIEKLRWKVRKYLSSKRFGDYLTKEMGFKYSNNQINKMKTAQLHTLLAKIRVSIDHQNIDGFYDRMISGGTMAIETTLSPFYDIEGFSDMLMGSDQFLNCVEKYKIESDLPNIPASVQLPIIMFNTAIVCHHMNQVKKSENNQHQPKMNPPDTEKVMNEVETITDSFELPSLGSNL